MLLKKFCDGSGTYILVLIYLESFFFKNMQRILFIISVNNVS